MAYADNVVPSADILEQKLINVGNVIESQLDAELERLEKLDDSDLERLRKMRLDEIKQNNSQKQEWLKAGHGEYTELTDEREFFEASKRSSKLVVHFYSPTSENCQIIDKHFGQTLCKKHLETRFCKMNTEKTPFLAAKLKIKHTPALVLISDGQIIGQLRPFDSSNTTKPADLTVELLEWRLATCQIIDYKGDLKKPPCDSSKSKPENSIFGLKQKDKCKKSIKGGKNEDSDDDDDSGNDW